MLNRNVAVGLFAVCGVGLFVFAIFLIGNQHSFFAKHFEVYTDFKNLNGVARGAKVQVAGFDAGEVKNVRILSSPAVGFRLTLELSEKTRPLVRSDSVAVVASEGVVGDKYVLVGRGSPSAPEAPQLSILPSREASDISELLEKGTALVGNASEVLNSVSTRLNAALDAVTATVNNADDLVVGLKQGRGAVGMLLRDEKTAADLRETVASIRSATSSLNHASAQADTLVSDLQSRKLPAKVDDVISDFQSRKLGQKFDATMDDVQVIVRNVGATTQQLQATVAKALAPDALGRDAGDNIRETLSNVNQATVNVAEDTEALKHGFFFRGFFKRRGYYSLARLEPEAYRKNKTFANTKNSRAWLEAADLFERRPGGAETLSRPGELRIDAAVAQFEDRAAGGPIVVEGYAVSDLPGDALELSWSRAVLVRNYLHSRFRIDTQNIGTVPLRGTPPPSVHRESWNGVCLVVLAHQAG